MSRIIKPKFKLIGEGSFTKAYMSRQADKRYVYLRTRCRVKKAMSLRKTWASARTPVVLPDDTYGFMYKTRYYDDLESLDQLEFRERWLFEEIIDVFDAHRVKGWALPFMAIRDLCSQDTYEKLESLSYSPIRTSLLEQHAWLAKKLPAVELDIRMENLGIRNGKVIFRDCFVACLPSWAVLQYKKQNTYH